MPIERSQFGLQASFQFVVVHIRLLMYLRGICRLYFVAFLPDTLRDRGSRTLYL